VMWPRRHKSPTLGSMSVTYHYDLANLAHDHPAGYKRELKTWADCLAARVGMAAGGSGTLELRARHTRTTGRATRDSLVVAAAPHSTPSDIARLQHWLPATDISERGALAVAAASVHILKGLRLREVTLKGQRGDFWLEDNAGVAKGLIEMSGTQAGSLCSVYFTKRKQVLGNSTANACFVSVTRFNSRDSYFCRVR